jgi:hypothetical protein
MSLFSVSVSMSVSVGMHIGMSTFTLETRHSRSAGGWLSGLSVAVAGNLAGGIRVRGLRSVREVRDMSLHFTSLHSLHSLHSWHSWHSPHTISPPFMPKTCHSLSPGRLFTDSPFGLLFRSVSMRIQKTLSCVMP